MSAKDFLGSYHAVKTFMRQAQDEIDRGERKGADRRFVGVTEKIQIPVARIQEHSEA